MKILVTGGAGFIGSHIVDYLLEKGHSVRVLDNLSYGFIKNIEHHIGKENFEFVQGDVTNLSQVSNACDGIDAISHQAGIHSIKSSIDNPLHSHNVNVNGFMNILIAAKEKNIKRIIYASSMALYGDSDILPNTEEHIGKLKSTYSISKYVNELYASNFTELYDMECIGLRYFNVYGPRQEYESAYATIIPKMIYMIKTNNRPTINGDGSYVRDFTFISNVVDANYLALTTENKKCFGNTFNIGTGEKITMLELFNSIKKNTNSNIEPIFGPVRIGDIKCTYADITKSYNLLNYSPKIDFANGLVITIRNFSI